MANFPEGFLWGASTSAHQVEGNNLNSDWWHWEQNGHGRGPSGAATNHYSLYEADFDLAGRLNHNSHRFSLEWSRVEPLQNQFSPEGIGHYKQVVAALKARGIEPVVTLHHFTNPTWFSREGGWLNPEAARIFCRYARRMVEELSEDVKFWITINEPVVLCYFGYVKGIWPPGARSLREARQALANLLSAHLEAYRIVHDVYREKYLDSPMVSIAQNIQLFHPCARSFRLMNKFAVYLRDINVNYGPVDFLAKKKSLDFIGVNYYGRQFLRFAPFSASGLFAEECLCPEHSSRAMRNSLGWEIYPKGMLEVLLKMKKYRLPVIITENGVCTQDDNLRWYYISEHLKSVSEALLYDVDVRGYLYWSLLDNFEWHEGFVPRFGLVEVDYANFQRRIRKSAEKFAQVCKTNSI